MKGKLFILIFLMASCAMYAQEQGHLLRQKVTITFKESTVAVVLKKLEKEVDGMVFMYSSSTFDLKREVSESFVQMPLREVLEKIFEGLNIEFQERKNKLLLKPGKPKGKQKTRKPRPKTEVEQEVGDSPKRRRIIPTRPASKERAKIIQEKISKENPAPKELRDSSLVRTKEVVSQEELKKSKRENIATIKHHQEFHFQPILKSAFVGQIQIEGDSSYLSEKLYKRLLAKEQRNQERANETKKFRIYGSSYTGYTSVNGEAGIQLGGSVMWLKNKRWGFGLSGYAVQSSEAEDPILLNPYRLAGGYGGVSVSYTLNPINRIHLSFPMMVGGGGIAYNRNNDVGLNPGEEPTEASRAFFVLESGAIVEANVIKYLRVGLGVSYRLTSNTLLNYSNNPEQIAGKSALAGLNFGLTVKFGLF